MLQNTEYRNISGNLPSTSYTSPVSNFIKRVGILLNARAMGSKDIDILGIQERKSVRVVVTMGVEKRD